MLTVAGSGIFGRYFYAKIHHGLYGSKPPCPSCRSARSELRERSTKLLMMPELVKLVEDEEQRLLAVADRHTCRCSMFARPRHRHALIRSGALAAAPLCPQACHARHSRASQSSRQAERRFERVAFDYVARRMKATREVVEFRSYEKLFSVWHVLHMPLISHADSRRHRACDRRARVLTAAAHRMFSSRDLAKALLLVLLLPRCSHRLCTPRTPKSSHARAAHQGPRQDTKANAATAMTEPTASARPRCASTVTRKSPPTSARRPASTARMPRQPPPMPRLPHGAPGPRRRHQQAEPEPASPRPDRISRCRMRTSPWPATGCHAPTRRIARRLPTCIDCHQQGGPARGQARHRLCTTCHDAKTLAERHVRSREDRLPAHDKHREVPCAACHVGQHYKGTPKQCVACHVPDDVHKGSRGPQCANCHSTTDWRLAEVRSREGDRICPRGQARPDRLRRLPSQRQPEGADPQGLRRLPPGAGRARQPPGPDCGQCHGNEKWKPPTFDHTRDGHWELTGRHQKVRCHTCHTAAVATQKLPTDCASCHRASDVHAASSVTECDQCHTTEGWQSVRQFRP